MSATTTVRSPRAVKLDFGGYYATATGIKLSTRGKVVLVGQELSAMTKSGARKLRKALRRAGFARHAAASRN